MSGRASQVWSSSEQYKKRGVTRLVIEEGLALKTWGGMLEDLALLVWFII